MVIYSPVHICTVLETRAWFKKNLIRKVFQCFLLATAFKYFVEKLFQDHKSSVILQMIMIKFCSEMSNTKLSKSLVLLNTL